MEQLAQYQQAGIAEMINFLERKANEYKQAGQAINGSVPINGDISKQAKEIYEHLAQIASTMRKEEVRYYPQQAPTYNRTKPPTYARPVQSKPKPKPKPQPKAHRPKPKNKKRR